MSWTWAAQLLSAVRDLVSRYRHVLVAFAASRVLIIGVILLSQLILIRGQYHFAQGILPVLLNWDGERWYLDIARHSYHFYPGRLSNVGFFPFYPLLVKSVSFLFHDFRIAALLVSNTCLLAAGMVLHALIKLDYKEGPAADHAVTFLMFSPVSFFFSSAYTESTFLLLSLGSFLAARKGHWFIAVLCGAALSGTRNIGVFIALPLLVEFIRQTWRREVGIKSLLRPKILLLGFVPAGLFLFLIFNYMKFGDPFAYVKATAVWGRRFASPYETFAAPLIGPWGGEAINEPFHRLVSVSAVAAAGALWASAVLLKVRPSYLLYAALLLAIYMCGNSLEAMPRYLSVVFPLVIALSLLTTRFQQLYEPLLACSIGILTLMTMLQANGFWIT